MKRNLKKLFMIALCFICFLTPSFAQSTLEWSLESSDLTPVGPSTSPIIATFIKDAANAPGGTVFSPYSPTLTATISFRNQQRSSTMTGSTVVLPGLTFGGRNALSTGGTVGVQAPGSAEVFNVYSANIPVQLPKNTMFMSNPDATPVNKTDILGNAVGAPGFGWDAQASTGATSPIGDDTNTGVSIFSSVDPLYKNNLAKDGRFYYGDLVITFNRPVKNPVIHLAGLGGSYNYAPFTGGPRQKSYFTTELELNNTGLTSTLMAGNPNIELVGNNILNSSTTPNAGSYDDGSNNFGIPDYGAATGSVRVNGSVQELVYRIYVRGAATSDFNFSKSQADITAATRDPLNGDFWYLGISLKKPTQEISGTVFIDADGLVDNNVNKSAGVANPTTNIGGQLYVNLLRPDGRVVEQQPVGSDGTYLFSNVPLLAAGNYSVQLTTVQVLGATYATSQPAPPSVLPDGWVNTGEFVSDPAISGNTGVGNDGLVNGRMVVPTLGSDQSKPQNNFGIERTPETLDYTKEINIPTSNQIINLNSISLAKDGSPLQVLVGSDAEDLPIPGSLSNKTVKITTLLFTTAGSSATLLYGGAPVTLNQIIPNYNPALLQIRVNSTTPTPGLTATTTFTYTYVDAAGKEDPTPGSYTLLWQFPVPVILEDFSVVKSNCVATLNWKTTAEINSDKFEIEMATIANPRFVKVGTIPAKGNSTSVSNYQTLFPMESGSVYQFRLKLINVDGSFGYSDIRTVSCIEKQEISIKPNPSIDIFKIAGMEKGKNVVSVLSADGKLVQVYEFVTINGEINLAKFAKGTYVIKIENENGTTEVKRVVKN